MRLNLLVLYYVYSCIKMKKIYINKMKRLCKNTKSMLEKVIIYMILGLAVEDNKPTEASWFVS